MSQKLWFSKIKDHQWFQLSSSDSKLHFVSGPGGELTLIPVTSVCDHNLVCDGAKCKWSCSCCPLQLGRNTQTPAATRTNKLEIIQPEKNKLNKELRTGETPPTKGSRQSGARFVCVLSLFRKNPLFWKHNCSICLEEQTLQCPSLKGKMKSRKTHKITVAHIYTTDIYVFCSYISDRLLLYIYFFSQNWQKNKKTWKKLDHFCLL